MKPPLNNVAYLVSTTRNAYGDYTLSTEAKIPCHFREITGLSTTANNEVVVSDAMAWFEADSEVVKGSILRIEDTYYRVERLTKARPLYNVNVRFIKTELLKYGEIS